MKCKPASRAKFGDPVLIVPSAVISRKNIDGTVNILHLDSNTHFFSLDGASAEFWNMIDGKKCYSKIVENVSSKCDLNVATLRRHFSKLVKDLKKNHLIDYQAE